LKSLTVILDNKLHFSANALKSFNRTAHIGLQKLLSYPNSKYLENEKYGYSNYGIPSHLYTYHIDRDRFSVYRGEFIRITNYLLKFDIEIILVDNTVVSEDIDFGQSNTVLREDQNQFLDAVLPFKDGIGLAYTSFGKSVTVLEWIRILKQRTLILVHTTFLQKQWIEEMTNPKLFNIDKKRIGGAGGCFGGKKFKIGDINVSLYHSAKKDKIISEYKKIGIGAVFVDEVQKAVIDDIQKVVNNLPAKYKFGVTAGIKRKDGKEFMTKACIGPVRYEAIETASDSKILANIEFHKTNYDNEDYEEDNNYTALINDMALDRERNIQICQLGIQRVKQHGDLVIIFVERVIQAGILAKYLSKFRVELLLGPTNIKKIRENTDMLSRVPKGTLDILEKYDYKTAYERVKELGNKKQLDFIIGTQKMEVGLSIRPVTFGILSTPAGNNLERFNQILGRLERTFSELQEKLFGGKKNIPIMAVMVDKTRVSQNAKYSIESKYEDRILSARKKRPKDKAKAITRRRPKVEVPKVKVKRKEIDYKSSKPKVRVRKRTLTKE
jgi:superfamily II DNA or RNA helicase